MPAPDTVAGLVLAGGQGRRMGGVDKGLQDFHGRPLARHALERLRPQVGPLMVSANRHAGIYAAWGVPVLRDDGDGTVFDGPLAGLLSGLRHSPAPWVASVPCDTPFFPADLVARLAAAAAATGARAAVAWAPGDEGRPRAQPVFCLLHTGLQTALAGYLAGGGRKAMAWLEAQGAAAVPFDDPQAFRNANTLADLAALTAGSPGTLLQNR